MGACGSTSADADEKARQEVDHEDVSVKVKSSEKKQDSELDFRETLKGTLIVVLERLAGTLEYESDAYLEIARTMEKDNFMDLMKPHYFDKFFREQFDLKEVEVKEPEVDESNALHEYQKFTYLLQAVKEADYKQPYPSRKDLAAGVQKAAKKTQDQLKAAIEACDGGSSEMKKNLKFFVKVFEFLQGDIGGDNNVLYDNIDKLCGDDE